MGQQRAAKPRASTLYAYSSSEESVSLPFIVADASDGRGDDDETVETLCEPAIHHSTSTPSLVHLADAQRRQWLGVGSSRSTPRSSARRRPDAHADSTSADDPPELGQQCQLLLQQTAAMKTTLCGLEAEFGASRRDLGWLQENLTSVRGATGSVAEKLAKMQSQVAAMERQIAATVKVPPPSAQSHWTTLTLID